MVSAGLCGMLALRAEPPPASPSPAGAWVRGPPARIHRGMGKPGFPIPLLAGCAPHTLLRAGVGGNPASPYPCLRARPSRGRGRGSNNDTGI